MPASAATTMTKSAMSILQGRFCHRGGRARRPRLRQPGMVTPADRQLGARDVEACEDLRPPSSTARHAAGLPARGDPAGRGRRRLIRKGRGEGIPPDPIYFSKVGALPKPPRQKGRVGLRGGEYFSFPTLPTPTTKRGASPVAPAASTLPQPCGDAAIGLRLVGIRRGGNDRRAGIGRGADVGVFSGTSPRCQFPATAHGQEFPPISAAIRAAEVAHVLDDAEHRHVDLLEHRHARAARRAARCPAAS